MAELREEIKNTNTNEVSDEVKAFQADVALAQYQHRVESGALTEEEKEDRAQLLSALGF
jgi:ABC-type Fe2+-enterobactin transport system substrate-binding protein